MVPFEGQHYLSDPLRMVVNIAIVTDADSMGLGTVGGSRHVVTESGYGRKGAPLLRVLGLLPRCTQTGGVVRSGGIGHLPRSW